MYELTSIEDMPHWFTDCSTAADVSNVTGL